MARTIPCHANDELREGKKLRESLIWLNSISSMKNDGEYEE